MQRAPAELVAANGGARPVRLVQLVVREVRGHVAQADDGAAEVAVGGAGAVGALVGGQAREDRLGFGGEVKRVAFLWDFEVTELAEDEFARADGGAVPGEFGNRWEGKRGGWPA